jgi:hypothetical protein|tara:strand:+ start:448 stop:621 length:174 start_codon:yes stop_codon:yes gene_type:complete
MTSWYVNPDSWDYRHGYNAGVKKTLESIKKYEMKYIPKNYSEKISKDLFKRMWYSKN